MTKHNVETTGHFESLFGPDDRPLQEKYDDLVLTCSRVLDIAEQAVEQSEAIIRSYNPLKECADSLAEAVVRYRTQYNSCPFPTSRKTTEPWEKGEYCGGILGNRLHRFNWQDECTCDCHFPDDWVKQGRKALQEYRTIEWPRPVDLRGLDD